MNNALHSESDIILDYLLDPSHQFSYELQILCVEIRPNDKNCVKEKINKTVLSIFRNLINHINSNLGNSLWFYLYKHLRKSYFNFQKESFEKKMIISSINKINYFYNFFLDNDTYEYFYLCLHILNMMFSHKHKFKNIKSVENIIDKILSNEKLMLLFKKDRRKLEHKINKTSFQSTPEYLSKLVYNYVDFMLVSNINTNNFDVISKRLKEKIKKWTSIFDIMTLHEIIKLCDMITKNENMVIIFRNPILNIISKRAHKINLNIQFRDLMLSNVYRLIEIHFKSNNENKIKFDIPINFTKLINIFVKVIQNFCEYHENKFINKYQISIIYVTLKCLSIFTKDNQNIVISCYHFNL